MESASHAEPLVIDQDAIALGESREVHLKFSESYLGQPLTVPMYVMRAREPGPRICITGVLHGDELNGMGIVRELLYDRPPDLQRGTLILIPALNLFGLERHARYMPDRRDLNRSFPGSDTGSVSARLAYTVFSEIIKKCDFGIDLHTAAVRRTNYPNVRAHMRDPRVKELATAFGNPLILNSRGPVGSLRRTATESGVPTIILEAGEVWKIEPAVVEIGVQGCLNVLKTFGMIEGEPVLPIFQVTVSRTTWVRADNGGLLIFHKKAGELVRKGEQLVTCESIFGAESHTLASPCDGIIMGMTTLPMVKPGEPIYHLGVLGKKSFKRAEASLYATQESTLYSRVQDDLATNVHIHEVNPSNDESTLEAAE